jgi:4-amino-4-deoxychorismate lyase
LVESIRADDGRFDNPGPHIDRMRRSRRELFGLTSSPPLERALEEISGRLGPGRWKVRVLYDTEIRAVEAAPYEFKPFRSAALVDGGTVSYPHKTVERNILDDLSRRARERGADTALIVSGGFITDFSYANAAFFDGRTWFTPAVPLLEGTRRARLLAAGRLQTADIRPADLIRFSSVCPVNAMLDLGEVTLSVRDILQPEGPMP